MDFSVIDKYLEQNTDSIINTLGELVSIPSKRGTPEEGKPFGEACAEALAKMEGFARDAGLSAENLENYMLECDYNDRETVLGIIAHLDVVPEGDGWDTDPFELVQKDGVLFGRGTIDDKGPAVAAFYAVKALRENGVELSKNVRLLFGSDEESGMQDLEYYRNKKALPKMMLSPDGEFPVINVEKGVCQVSFKKHISSCNAKKALVAFSAGSVVNAVPDKAQATVTGITVEQAASLCSEDTTVEFDFIPVDDGVSIFAKGVSAHGSTPEKGDNALTGLMKAILSLDLDETDALKTVRSLYGLFPYGEGDGEHAGLKMSDAESGDLTALLSLFSIENGNIRGGIDIRFPATVKLAAVKEIVIDKLSAIGFELDFTHDMEGHLVPGDSDFIKTLLDCYSEVTNQKGECIAEGGATYLHTVDGGVAFGAEMPGEENNMHGANEHINISTLLNVAKIYARAIYRLCK